VQLKVDGIVANSIPATQAESKRPKSLWNRVKKIIADAHRILLGLRGETQ